MTPSDKDTTKSQLLATQSMIRYHRDRLEDTDALREVHVRNIEMMEARAAELLAQLEDAA